MQVNDVELRRSPRFTLRRAEHCRIRDRDVAPLFAAREGIRRARESDIARYVVAPAVDVLVGPQVELEGHVFVSHDEVVVAPPANNESKLSPERHRDAEVGAREDGMVSTTVLPSVASHASGVVGPHRDLDAVSGV